MARISLTRLGKTFASRHGNVTALADINLDIADQQFVTIVGASGCGKSTLLNLLAGFDTATSGEITVDGAPVAGPGPGPWRRLPANCAVPMAVGAGKYCFRPQAARQQP